MKTIKIIISIILCFSFMLVSFTKVCADGEPRSERGVDVVANVETNPLSDISADSAVVIEINTGTILAEADADKQQSISHLAKLMTLLLVVEEIDAGKLDLNDIVKTSSHANSMNGTQIWLNIGEEISVEELIKAIAIGNANDACVALAEKVGKSEGEFVAMMNNRANELSMTKTTFVDCTGIDKNTVSTARDLALLSAELLKHESLTPYFTTWIDNIRNQAVELVNTNRLIRTYNGITGLKSSASEQSGECLISSAKRGEMDVCVVLLNCKSTDDKFSEAKKAMDSAFSLFEIYTPEIDEKIYEKISVSGGEKLEINVKVSGLTPVIIPKGTYRSITSEFAREDKVTAPVKEGQMLGAIEFFMNDEVIVKGDIVASCEVKEIGMKFALKKVLLNLLKI